MADDGSTRRQEDSGFRSAARHGRSAASHTRSAALGGARKIRRLTHAHGAGESGLGSRLVQAALDDVRGKGERVVPLCSFVRGWIERHPDYADLVADGQR